MEEDVTGCGYGMYKCVRRKGGTPSIYPMYTTPTSSFRRVGSRTTTSGGGKLSESDGICAIICTSMVIILITIILTFASRSLEAFRRGGRRGSGERRVLHSVGIAIPTGRTRTGCSRLVGRTFLMGRGNRGMRNSTFTTSIIGTTTRRRCPIFITGMSNRPGCVVTLRNTNL